MPSELAGEVVMAVHAFASDYNAPTSVSTVLQRIYNKVHDGKLTMEKYNEISRYMETAEDMAIDDLDELVKSVTDPVKNQRYKEAVHTVMDGFAKGGSANEAAAVLQKVSALGTKTTSLGVGAPRSAADVLRILDNRLKSPLPTGIFEVDVALGGGLEKQSLGVYMATTGGGKTLSLCHTAVTGLIEGYNVAYLSLELSEDQIVERLMTNLLDMTVKEMEYDPEEVVHRFNLWKMEGVGDFRVLRGEPKLTTPHDMEVWLRDLEREQKFVPRLIVVDYADKMISKVGSNKSSYEDNGLVYEQIRNIAVARDGWAWTATQAKGGNVGKKKLTTDAAADSQNKMRVADVAISIARTSEDMDNDQVRFGMMKHRTGAAHQQLGPFTWDPQRGRVVMMNRKAIEPWHD